MKLRFLGKEYRGNDPVLGKSLIVRNGDVIDVSEEKGTQLLKDYPRDFVFKHDPEELVVPGPAPEPTPPAEAEAHLIKESGEEIAHPPTPKKVKKKGRK